MEPTTPNTTHDSGIGAIVGSIIVVLVIVAGAFYLLGLVRERQAAQNPPADTAAATAQIEAELQQINLDDVDAELEAIEAEF